MLPAEPAEALQRENEALRLQLSHLEEALRAIREGEVDGLLVPGAAGERLFTLEGADRAYRLLVEEMGEGALTLAPDGVVLYANRRFAELLGRPLRVVIGSHVSDWFALEGHATLAALLAPDAATSGGAPRAELDLLTAEGLRVPALLSVNRLVCEGEADAICMVATDLTWQRRTEAAVQAREILQGVIESQRLTEESLRVSVATLSLHDNALGAISQGVLIANAAGCTTYANRACEEMSGYSALEMAGRTASMMQGRDTDPAVVDAIRAAFDAAEPFHGELLNYRKDGTPFRNELSVTPVFDEHGIATQFVGVMRDVTARWQADEQLLLAAKLFEQSSEGFMITDADCRIVKVNPAFTAISGYTEADALGRNPSMLASGRHDPAFFGAMWAELGELGSWQGEIWNRRKDGSLYPEWLSISSVAGAADRVTHYIASFSDITHRKAADDRIRHLAHYDALTGLPNRALLQDRATLALKAARRSGESVALMFLDLDHFKHVNDSLGHDIGDQLLVAVAGRFKATLREPDTLCRMGGDEFVLLLPGTDATGAAHVAQKLTQLMQRPHHLGVHEITITPSIGIAMFPEDGPDFEVLARCADAAMYRAKQGGRNDFAFHTTEIQAQSARVLKIENALRRAIEHGELTMHYQPQTSRGGEEIRGAEALLRWHHPDLGWVSPAEFIPIAESSGLITAIGEWALRTAVQQLRTWTDRGLPPMMMAVNLSMVQFRQPNLATLVRGILDEAGVDPRYLELELTESVVSDDPVGAIDTMRRLHECGIRLSIDDFGTGYSSLSYLKRFRVFRLKIDQSFVQSIMEDPEDQAIVAAIIALAKSLGLQTIAEGVETRSQADYLRAQGCDEMQGYWFSRPLPAAEFEAFVRGRTAGDPTPH
jgi:diguanylate cyclase (GGDEF)-like protein/PAS domain S-box-containing protein